jgi:hypothetical protein
MAEPPSKTGADHERPIYISSVFSGTLARFVGESGIYAAKIVTESETKLKSIMLRD